MNRGPEELPEEVIALLAPLFPGFDVARIRVYEGIPFYVLGKPIGYADRYRIYFAPGAYRVDTIEGVALLAHEITHCRQYRALGTWGFRARYIWAYCRNRLRGMSGKDAYLNIPFEIEAREIEARVFQALQRMQEKLI
jgi:Domain of unknown function (DUF4157)